MIPYWVIRDYLKGWEKRFKECQDEFHRQQGALGSLVRVYKANPTNKELREKLNNATQESNAAFRDLMFAEGAIGLLERLSIEINTGDVKTDFITGMMPVPKGELLKFIED